MGINLLNFITKLSTIGFTLDIFHPGDWIRWIWVTIVVAICKTVFSLVEFAYKLFEIAYSINVGTISGFLQGLINRITALIIVIVVYNLATTIIKLMSKSEANEIKKQSTELIKNIFITAALLIGYNLVFGFFNELSLLMMGNKVGYDYPIISQIITVDKKADSGVITRLIFGNDQKGDVGTVLSCGLYSNFVSAGDCSEGFKFNSWDASREALEADDTDPITWYWPLGLIIGGYMAYYIFKATIAIIARVFKLTLLQLAAPIPISSILLEGTGKGSKFAEYCKSYVATFAELFTRVFTMLIVCAVVLNFQNFLNPFTDAANNAVDAVSYSAPNKLALNDNELVIPEVGEVDMQDNTGGGNTDQNGAGEEQETEAEETEEDSEGTDVISRCLFYGLLAVGAFLFANEAPKIIDDVLGTKTASSMGAIGSGILGSVGGAAKGFMASDGRWAGERALAAAQGAKKGYNAGSKLSDNKAQGIVDALKSGSTAGQKAFNEHEASVIPNKLRRAENKNQANMDDLKKLDKDKAALKENKSNEQTTKSNLQRQRTAWEQRQTALNNAQTAKANMEQAAVALRNADPADVMAASISYAEAQNTYNEAVDTYESTGGTVNNGSIDFASEQSVITTNIDSIDAGIQAADTNIQSIDTQIQGITTQEDTIKSTKEYRRVEVLKDYKSGGYSGKTLKQATKENQRNH